MSPHHSRGRRFLAGLILVLGIAALSFLLLRPGDPAGAYGLAVGRPAPEFSVRSLDGGGPIRLADLRGQVVIANFWASWCVSCRTEMPALEQIYRRYRDQGFTVLGLNIGGESDVAVRAFVDRYQLTFPIGVDDEGVVTAAYEVVPLPSTYVIGRDGQIRARVLGAMTEAQLEQIVIEALQAG